MNIEIYAPCHQEARILPYFMRHYNQYGQVFLFEGDSTDDSRKIAQDLGAIVLDLDTGGQTRDDILMDLRNNCWKQSKADWVMVVDCDEFIYHPNFVEYLSTIPETIVLPRTFEMIADVFPTTQGQIYEEVQYGFETTSKMYLFKPGKVKNMAFGAGSHSAQPEGEVYINRTSEIIAMHMRHLSVERVLRRNAHYATRMSEVNKKNGWGWHVTMPEDDVRRYFNENRQRVIKVV